MKPSFLTLESSLRSKIWLGTVLKINDLNCTQAKEKFALEQLIAGLKKGQYFFAGCIPKWFLAKCEQKEVYCYDYMEVLQKIYLPLLLVIQKEESLSLRPLFCSPL